jgi:hypothetical protein
MVCFFFVLAIREVVKWRLILNLLLLLIVKFGGYIFLIMVVYALLGLEK